MYFFIYLILEENLCVYIRRAHTSRRGCVMLCCTFPDVLPPPPSSSFHHLFPLFLKPFLSVMLNKGGLEVLLFTGSHSPRRVLRRADQGVLNDGREHSLRIERLPGRLCARLLFISNTVVQRVQRFLLSVSGLLLFRWTRRPRGRPHCPTTSPSTCTASSWVGFLQKWSRPPTESMCPSRDVYGT